MSPDCPDLPSDENKRFVKNGRSYEHENKLFAQKLKKLKAKFKNVVRKTRIYWMCEFYKILDLPENHDFKKNIKPSLIYWKRMIPRDCIYGGWREVYSRKWEKNDHPDEQLIFLVSSLESFIYKLTPNQGVFL